MGYQTKNAHPPVADNANPKATKSQALLEPSPSELSKDSLIQDLKSGNSYNNEGDIFPDSKSIGVNNDIFRNTVDKDTRDDSCSIIGDDMSLSVATSADFSFATQTTENYHYPAQYNPLQQKHHEEERTSQRVAAEVGGAVRDSEDKEGKENLPQKRSWRDRINRMNSSKNSTKGAENELFCGIGSALNRCFAPVNEEDEGMTKNRASEMRDFFSPCIRATLDNTVGGTEEKSVADDSTAGTVGTSVNHDGGSTVASRTKNIVTSTF